KRLAHVGARSLVERRVPTFRRVVVVRARIRDGVLAMVRRQVRVVGLAVETELQDDHARQREAVAQRADLVRDQTEILGDERYLTEPAAHGLKQRVAGRLAPLSVARRLAAGRHAPVRLERAEVVDPEQVETLELRGETREPPGELA